MLTFLKRQYNNKSNILTAFEQEKNKHSQLLLPEGERFTSFNKKKFNPLSSIGVDQDKMFIKDKFFNMKFFEITKSPRLSGELFRMQQFEIDYLIQSKANVSMRVQTIRAKTLVSTLDELPQDSSPESLKTRQLVLGIINEDLICSQIDKNSTELHLNNLNISYLPVSIFEHSELGKFWGKLRYIMLNDNHLSILPENLLTFESLVFLNISHNKFTHVPSVLKDLKNLKALNINHNYLTSSEHHPLKELANAGVSLIPPRGYGGDHIPPSDLLAYQRRDDELLTQMKKLKI